MTTDTQTDTLHGLRLIARPERQWRPADYPPCATNASFELPAVGNTNGITNGNTAACSAYGDRLRAQAVAYELRLRSLSDELHQVRLAKATLEQEMATEAHRSSAQSDGQPLDRRGEGAR